MEANVERFRTETKPFLDDWKSIDLRVVASTSKDGWIFGGVRAVLDSSEPSDPNTQNLPSVDGLLVIHESRDISMLNALLDELSTGELHIGGKMIITKFMNQSPQIQYWFTRMSSQDSRQRLGIGSQALYLQSWSGSSMIESDRDRIDSALRSFDPPWDGIDDLARNFLRVSPNLQGSMPSKFVEVIAPIAAFFTGFAFPSDEKVVANVEMAPSIASDQIKLSAIGYFGDGSQTRLSKSKKEAIDPTHLRFEVVFPAKPILVVLVLIYRGLDIDRIQAFGRVQSGISPRSVILQEQGIENFLSSLGEEKDRYFEDKVAILFHLLGLSPGHYGRIDQDDPDILVFPPANDWMLAVECTNQEPDLNNKLSKLATRAKLLATNLPGVTVYPVLITKFSRAILNETDKEKASKEGIAIVTGDDFKTLLQMAIEGAEPTRIRDYFVARLPGPFA